MCYTYDRLSRVLTRAVKDLNDTYGKQIEHIGNSDVIFAYNGKDGVVTEPNGLIYMRARYYSPELRRFINADVVPGEISNSITLNRYAYANGNPVSFVDPFGLSAENGRQGGVVYFGPQIIAAASAGGAAAIKAVADGMSQVLQPLVA